MKNSIKKILALAIVVSFISQAFGMKAPAMLPSSSYATMHCGTPKSDTISATPLKHLPPDIKAALRKSRFASWHVDQITSMDLAAGKQYVVIVDNHAGMTMPSEGYGGWDDYRLVFDASCNMISSKEL